MWEKIISRDTKLGEKGDAWVMPKGGHDTGYYSDALIRKKEGLYVSYVWNDLRKENKGWGKWVRVGAYALLKTAKEKARMAVVLEAL